MFFDEKQLQWIERANSFTQNHLGISTGDVLGSGAVGQMRIGSPDISVIRDVQSSEPAQGRTKSQPTVAIPFHRVRQCAVKFCPPGRSLLPIERIGIQRVMELQHKYRTEDFRCRGLLPIYGFMDFEEGLIEILALGDESLEHLLWARGCLDIDEALSIFRTISEATQMLRDHGFRHQDIRPANIVRVEKVWMLADFGMVIPEGPEGVKGPLAGFPYGPDTAGLARTLYAMLAGEYMDSPIDPLPPKVGPLGHVIHDLLIRPACRPKPAFQSPQNMLRALDAICDKPEPDYEIPPQESLRQLADGLRNRVLHIRRFFYRYLLLPGIGMGILFLVLMLNHPGRLVQYGWLPLLIPYGILLLCRRWSLLPSVAAVARRIEEDAGTPNLLMTALDYAVGNQSALERAQHQCGRQLRLLNPDVPAKLWLKESWAALCRGRAGSPPPFAPAVPFGDIARAIIENARSTFQTTPTHLETFMNYIEKNMQRIFYIILAVLILLGLLFLIMKRLPGDASTQPASPSACQTKADAAPDKPQSTGSNNSPGSATNPSNQQSANPLSESMKQQISKTLGNAQKALQDAQTANASADRGMQSSKSNEAIQNANRQVKQLNQALAGTQNNPNQTPGQISDKIKSAQQAVQQAKETLQKDMSRLEQAQGSATDPAVRRKAQESAIRKQDTLARLENAGQNLSKANDRLNQVQQAGGSKSGDPGSGDPAQPNQVAQAVPKAGGSNGAGKTAAGQTDTPGGKLFGSEPGHDHTQGQPGQLSNKMRTIIMSLYGKGDNPDQTMKPPDPVAVTPSSFLRFSEAVDLHSLNLRPSIKPLLDVLLEYGSENNQQEKEQIRSP